MPQFNKGKRLAQLLLRKEDLRVKGNNQLLLLLVLITGLGLWMLYQLSLIEAPQTFGNWVAIAATAGCFFLAFKLSAADGRRRRAEAKAKASDLKFNKLYHSGLIGLWLTGADGGIAEANDAFLDLIGYTRAELEAGQVSWKDFTAPEYGDADQERLALLRQAGWCPPYEKEYIRKDGSRIKVMAGLALLSNDPKKGIMAYALDISKTQKMTEDVLRIFMEAPVCIVIRKGPDLKVSFINNAALAQNRLGREEAEGATSEAYFKKTATDFNPDILKEVYSTGRPFKRKTYPVTRKRDGFDVEAWYDIVAEPTHDADGQIDGVVTYSFDVSELVRANEGLSAGESRFRFIADAIPHKLWTLQGDKSAAYYNKGWYDYTGIDNFDDLHKNIWGLVHPDDRENSARLWEKVMQDGGEIEIEQRLRQHDGQYLWHLSRICAHKDDSGNIMAWVGTSTNIHAMKMALEKLAASEGHFRTLANNNSLLIWQTDAGGETIFVNDTWRAYTGITNEKTTVADWVNNIHPDDRDTAIADFKTAYQVKQKYQSKYRFKDARTGLYRWMLDSAQPVFDPEFSGYIGAMTDIHEQELAKQTIEELVKRKDEFFSIASHELKTPITTIKGSLQIIRGMLEQDMTRHALPLINKANKQMDRLTSLVNDLLDVNKIQSGRLELKYTRYSFNESLQECVSELELEYPGREIRLIQAPDVVVWADRDRAERVITNLVSNAFKFSAKDQPVTITLEKGENDLKCSVADNGIGIPADKQPYVFERFFSVHKKYNNYAGLGIGLYISAEIVRQHGGEIGLISEEGSGSTFWFTLPYPGSAV